MPGRQRCGLGPDGEGGEGECSWERQDLPGGAEGGAGLCLPAARRAAGGAPCSRPRRMSLHSWDKECEDRTSSEPTYSIASVYQFDVDEDLKGSERQEGSEYSEPSSTFHSDVPHVVPWKLIISLAFPAQVGRCQSGVSPPCANRASTGACWAGPCQPEQSRPREDIWGSG